MGHRHRLGHCQHKFGSLARSHKADRNDSLGQHLIGCEALRRVSANPESTICNMKPFLTSRYGCYAVHRTNAEHTACCVAALSTIRIIDAQSVAFIQPKAFQLEKGKQKLVYFFKLDVLSQLDHQHCVSLVRKASSLRVPTTNHTQGRQVLRPQVFCFNHAAR